MTYWGFLAAFGGLPAAAVSWLARRRYRSSDLAPVLLAVAVACGSAYPWDSFAVRHGFWFFSPERTAGWHLGLWALPLLALQWVVGRKALWRPRRAVAVGALGPALMLSLADGRASREWSGASTRPT